MRRISILLAVVASLTIAAPTMASANRLRIETGGTGVAELDGPTSATLSASPGSYAAVYVMARSTQHRSLDRVEMGFTVASGGIVSGGAPRLTVPIDEDGDGEWDDFASIDVFGCGAPVANGVLQDAVLVSTANPDCAVSLNAGGTYANWDAFATAHPSWRTAVGQQPFVIADWTADVTLTGIDLN